MHINRFLFLVVGILLCHSVYSGIEQSNNRIEGSDIFVGASFDLYDVKYLEMDSNPLWNLDFTNYRVSNTVQLGINPDVLQTSTYSGSIDIKVEYEIWNGTVFSTVIEYQTLSVDYDNSSGLAIIEDLSTFSFENAHYISVEIVVITGLNVNDVFLESMIKVERYYAFDGVAVVGTSYLPTAPNDILNADYIEFNWNTKIGAELYELEWVHINDYTINLGVYVPPTNLNYDFYLNSTRIVTSKTNYRIPKIYDHGYLIFRVRPIGMQGADFNIRYDGSWNLVENGTIASVPSNQSIPILNEYDPNMNWSHQVGYTEDGKRMEAVSFIDGLGRGRQTVAFNTVTEQAVVSNVYYDELGRPVISDLPTPVDGGVLEHYPAFNRPESAPGVAFMVDYFDDILMTPDCGPIGLGMATNEGAGKYYSSQKSNIDGEDVNIPDAENFPFTRVTYLDDFTGRVDRVSGAGASLKMGSGKETRYYYTSANQADLDKLFGSEVGLFEHYQKVTTVDPNGQAYIQYLDMAGRVVASYMTGPAPFNLDALGQALIPVLTTIDIIVNGSNQTEDLTPPSTSVTYSEYFSENDTYTFNYGFTPSQYESACLEETICFDCVYDLTLLIIDECDVEIKNITTQINGATFDAICNGESNYSYSEAITLSSGEYTIQKKLEVNQAAIDEYWCFYIDNYTCGNSISDYFNSNYINEPFVECTDNELIETIGGCDEVAQLMYDDVSPDGQYAAYTYNPTTGVYSTTDVTSIFYNNTYSTYSYLDELGNPIQVINPQTGTLVSPAVLNIADFINLFDNSWAPSLIDHHPESCYLDFCESNSASTTYDQNMQDIDDFDVAFSAGYFDPLNVHLITHSPILTTELDASPILADPFFTSTFGVTYVSNMQTIMDAYITLDDNGTPVTLTMWDYAIYMANINDCGLSSITACILAWRQKMSCNDDMVWILFREYYLAAKLHILNQAQQDYATANNCSNSCIGSSDAGCTIYANKQPRFGNAFIDLSGTSTSLQDIISSANPGALGQNVFDQLIADACTQMAEQTADQWISLLSGCDFVTNGVNLTNLRTDLIALIAVGCDQDHPMGASTTPAGVTITTTNSVVCTSLDEVLAAYLGANYESNWCTELLISSPGPYQTTEDVLATIQKPLDICGCDQVLLADALATSTSISLEEALELQTGISLLDADQLLCACEGALGDPWSPGYDWANENSSANIDLANSGYTVAAAMSCEECNVDCSTINTDVSALEMRFSNVTDFNTSTNYETILTNFLNQAYNYTLVYEDYEEFIGQCNATVSDPYCTVNPLLDDWADVMSLIAFRDQLLNGSTNTVDLLTENIVYPNSDLFGTFTADDYWGEVVGNAFVMHFNNSNCTYTITESDFDFSSIVSFGAIIPDAANCTSSNNSFSIEINYVSCGKIESIYLNVVTDCMEVSTCICSSDGLLLCNRPLEFIQEPCYEPQLTQLYQNAIESYLDEIDQVYIDFTEDYNSECSAAFATENFNFSGNFRNYQFTLFYYDQAGNLVKTIAPKGVDLLAQVEFPDVENARNSVVDATTYGNAYLPTHDYGTTYQYNSYNQLVTTTNPDHEGNTQFWYDRYGRIVASQNPVQAIAGKYSYSLYDIYGRPVQVGQVETTVPLTEIILKADDLGVGFQTWVGSGLIFEVTITTYDGILSTTISNKFKSGSQQNLRLRVASVAYYTSVTAATDVTTDYESATHYSYDIHGNVVEQLQDIPMMAPVQQDIKSTQYEFELISGNVSKVTYQEEELDFFEHSYQYDDLNRLTEVFTSTDNVHYTREAHYHYYDYGPLARTEIGQYQVQGMDYAYTINGWLKGMNASTLNTSRDMGKDGTSGFLSSNTTIHNLFAKDVVGYTMGYFSGDYTSIGNSTMELDAAGSNFETQSIDLFNGNISNIVTSIVDMTTLGTAYKYDQLQRLKEMTAFYNNNSTNDWIGAVATNEYYNAYTYDENGNILTLQRNGTVASGLYMDNFAYKYDGVDNGVMLNRSNRLNFVNESASDDATATSDDIKQLGMSSGNFEYDAIGQLTQDNSEGIEQINWRTGDKKIKSIIRAASDLTSPQIEFIYNPFGLRVLKIEKPRNNGAILPDDQWIYTYYSYDANGQVMAIYDVEMHAALKRATVEEFDIYGASRVGLLKSEKLIYYNGQPNYGNPSVKQNTLGDRYYEVTNHLGNVLAVVNDRKTVAAPGNGAVYVATVISASDFYPFGMLMPERSTSTDSYRYAYNGMEMDNEVSGNGNSYTTEFRQYDARLGRWKSLDPLMGVQPFQSPYQAFNNNPIFFTDPLGLIGGPYKETQKFDFENFENELPSSASKGTQINFSLNGTGSNGEYMPGNNISINYTFNGSQWDKKITFFEGPNNNGAPEIITYDDNPISGNENKTKETLANYLQDDYPNGPSYTNSSSGVTVSGGMASYSQNPTPSTELMGAEISENSPTPDNVVDELPMKSIPDLYAGEISLTTIVIENAIKFEGATKGIEVFSKFFSKANGVFGAVTNSIDVVNDVTTGTIDEHTYANGIQAVGYGIGTTLLFTPLAPIGGLILTVVGIADLIQWGVWDE